MNYGSIAYLNEGYIYLPEFLTKMINIDNGTNLTFLSYSKPDPNSTSFKNNNALQRDKNLKIKAYKHLPEKHDILVSPISFRSWPFLIRVDILIQERDGALAALTRYFKEMDFNILLADCHRSGFRHGVYSCFIEPVNLREGKYNFIDKNLSQGDTPYIIYDNNKLDKKEIEDKKINRDWLTLRLELEMLVSIIKHDLMIPTTHGDALMDINKLDNDLKAQQHEHISGRDYRPDFNYINDLIKERKDADAKLLTQEDLLENYYTGIYDPDEYFVNAVRRFIFIAAKNERLEGMVSKIKVASSLTHHFLSVSSNQLGQDRKDHYSKYESKRIKLPTSLLFEFKHNLGIDLSGDLNSPTFCFVNVDTYAPRLRITFTPKHEIGNFRRIIVDHRRDSLKPQSTKGLLSFITNILTCEFNLKIESIVDRVWLNKRKTELGKIEIIVENSYNSGLSWGEVQKRLESAIIRDFSHSKGVPTKNTTTVYQNTEDVELFANSSKTNDSNKNIKSIPIINDSETSVTCTHINPYRFFVSLKTSDEHFVKNTKKLLFKAGYDLGIYPDDFKFAWTHVSDVTDNILTTMRDSNAMIQIQHNSAPEDDDYTWLDSEYLAMKALNKPCARVCENKRFSEGAFSKLSKDMAPKIVDFSHGDIKIIKMYRDVLQELIMLIDNSTYAPISKYR